MSDKKIFVNLPVRDLAKSMEFFSKLGYSFNKQFTDSTAACMVISEDIYAMLLTYSKFKEFTPKPIADGTQTTEVLLALSLPSRAAVDALMTKALQAGASPSRPTDDLGFMYSRAFNDPDGHIWELVWMDSKAIHPED